MSAAAPRLKRIPCSHSWPPRLLGLLRAPDGAVWTVTTAHCTEHKRCPVRVTVEKAVAEHARPRWLLEVRAGALCPLGPVPEWVLRGLADPSLIRLARTVEAA